MRLSFRLRGVIGLDEIARVDLRQSVTEDTCPRFTVTVENRRIYFHTKIQYLCEAVVCQMAFDYTKTAQGAVSNGMRVEVLAAQLKATVWAEPEVGNHYAQAQS